MSSLNLEKLQNKRLTKYNFMISSIRFLLLQMCPREACKAHDQVSVTFHWCTFSLFHQAAFQQLIFLSTSSSILGMSRGEVLMAKVPLARSPEWVAACPEPFSYMVRNSRNHFANSLTFRRQRIWTIPNHRVRLVLRVLLVQKCL